MLVSRLDDHVDEPGSTPALLSSTFRRRRYQHTTPTGSTRRAATDSTTMAATSPSVRDELSDKPLDGSSLPTAVLLLVADEVPEDEGDEEEDDGREEPTTAVGVCCAGTMTRVLLDVKLPAATIAPSRAAMDEAVSAGRASVVLPRCRIPPRQYGSNIGQHDDRHVARHAQQSTTSTAASAAAAQ